MSENLEQNSQGNGPEAQVAAAFARLGIVLDDDNGMDTDTYVAALNGLADRMEASNAGADANTAAIAEITAKVRELGYEIPEDASGSVAVCAVLQGLVDTAAQAEEQLSAVKRQLSAQKGQVTKARNEAARTPDANARKLPEDRPLISRDDRQAIIDLVAASDRAEIVAFEDDAEILQIKPLDLKGQVAASLSEGGEGVTLNRYEKWLVLGPTDTTVSITSWGLYVDGELVAWRERPSGKLTLGSGTQFDLTPDVIL
jgi:hypothetical protein